MRPGARATLTEDIGGSRLLDRRPLAAMLPLTLVTSVLTRDPVDLRTGLAWVGVNLASLMLVWLWVELLRLTIAAKHRTAPVPIPVVMLIGASIGLMKGTTTSIFAWTAGLLPILMGTEEWWRALSTTTQGVVILPALTLLVATLDRYRDEYDRLVAARARATLSARDHEEDGGAPERRAELIAGFVEEARQRLSDADDRTVASVLERLVEERLRPVTRELWSPDDIGTDFRLRSLLRSAVVANPFPILPVAGLYAATSFLSRAPVLDVGPNLARTAIAVALIGATFVIARRVRPSGVRWAVPHLALTVLGVALLLTLVTEQLGPDGQGWRTGTVLMTLVLWITFLTIVSGAVAVAIRGGDRMREEIARVVERGGASDAVARVSQRLRDREVADHLHSSLQNRLIAASHRISAAGGSESMVRQELDAIELLLADLAAGAATRATPSAGLQAQFADLVARWEGFVTIAARLDPTLDRTDSAFQDRVAQVLSEAVNNAVRHGRAAHVDVRVTATDRVDVFDLCVEDDGVGPVLRGPGLGSALFTAMSGGDWTLEDREEGGSRLRLRLRASATPT